MDRNSIIGVVLIGIILLGYSYYMQPSQKELEAAKRKRDSIALIEQQLAAKQQSELKGSAIVSNDTLSNNNDTTQVKDSLINNGLNSKYGVFANAAKGEEKSFTLENSKLKLEILNKGGRVISAVVKNYTTYTNEPVDLIRKDRSKFNLNFYTSNNLIIQTQDLYFSPVTTNDSTIILRATTTSGEYIEYVYSLRKDSYYVDFSINMNGLNKIIASNRDYLSLDWALDIPKQEKGAKNEDLYSELYYKVKEDDVDYLNASSDTKEDVRTALRWIAFKDQFFTSIFIAKNQFEDAVLEQKRIYEKDTAFIKSFAANISIPYTSKPNESNKFLYYFGPNKYNILKEYSKKEVSGIDEYLELDKLIPLGWGIFGWVNRFAIIPLFNILNSFISNYGIIILLLTIIIKVVLFPLTYKSYMSTAKMKVLKPQIDEINKKIPKEKAMERQQATMALYKKAGVNPMGGCLPMLLQFPILIAMFKFFPASIELRHQSFLWATDLSSYDSILDLPFTIPFYGDHVSLFTLLMTISTLLYTKMQNDMNPQNSQMAGMKTMMYIMPIMFLFMLNSYSAGLTYYYFLANMITFAQMFFIKKMINEEEILKKIEAAKARPVKKSNFQKKLEEAAKRRQKR